jgi:hypothetical protein
MEGMGRAGRCVGMAVAALLMTGCGVDAPADGSAATTVPGSSPMTPGERFGVGGGQAGSSGEYGPKFPLTLRRTGGIAGFDDRIVLRADGKVLVDTRSIHGRVCTLSPAQQRQLISALSMLRLGPWPSTSREDDFTPPDPASPGESDPITISITDNGSRAVDLSDPSLGEVAGLVGSLVSDVTLSTPATTRCTTPTSPVPAPAL